MDRLSAIRHLTSHHGDPREARLRESADLLLIAAITKVEDAERHIRYDDVVAVLASITGEAAIVAAGIDIERLAATPGGGLMGPAINGILTGDTDDLAAVPPDSIVGILVRELVPDTVSPDVFDLKRLYVHVASNVGNAPWGYVTTTVPADHQPSVMPLRVAFELRETVHRAQAAAELPATARHVPCAYALAKGLKLARSQGADADILAVLALEVTFSMAKMVPMTRAAMGSAAAGSNPGA